MKTKAEIIREFDENSTHTTYQGAVTPDNFRNILEVLLDIRDLLDKEIR